LLIAGLHVPVIPLFEVVGNAGIVAPKQKGPTVENVGIILLELIIMVIEAVVAHCPAEGVKV
jgi:hypothetical protein